jgi:hypothetical protein
MVARIRQSSNLGRMLEYNEKKVTQQVAELIHASGFIQDTNRLTYEEKIARFEQLNTLNHRTEVNMLHISLNFDPDEQLNKELLTGIADRYMEGIGFDRQPYLVYEHRDADHPHLHIVTSAIEADGKRIPLHQLAETRSEPTRKAIEEEFHLIRAEGRQQEQVLQKIAKTYQYTSLEEYNALLRLHNLVANPVRPNPDRGHHGGLVYRQLDDLGNPNSPPIKASSFQFKPTLSWLDKQYDRNRQSREAGLESLRDRIDWARLQQPDSIRDFVHELRKESIELVVKQDALTWVDHRSKTVIAGPELGPAYGADLLTSYKQALQHETGRELTSELNRQNLDPLSLPPAFNPRSPQPILTIMEREPPWGLGPRGRDQDRNLGLEPTV